MPAYTLVRAKLANAFAALIRVFSNHLRFCCPAYWHTYVRACRCTFCEGCFANLVKFGGRCTKCQKGLPKDPSKFVANAEMRRAVLAFQQQVCCTVHVYILLCIGACCTVHVYILHCTGLEMRIHNLHKHILQCMCICYCINLTGNWHCVATLFARDDVMKATVMRNGCDNNLIQ